MKQLIVLISMILLGIGLAGFILSFNDTAKSMTDTTKDMLKEVMTTQEKGN